MHAHEERVSASMQEGSQEPVSWSKQRFVCPVPVSGPLIFVGIYLNADAYKAKLGLCKPECPFVNAQVMYIEECLTLAAWLSLSFDALAPEVL